MTIYNTGMANVKLGHNLSELLGIGTNLMFKTFVKQLTSPSTYFVHCDLIDKGKTCSMESLQLSWRGSIFVDSLLKRFTTKHHNNMFYVTRRPATMM